MIDIHNLSRVYRGGVRALDGITLSIGGGMFGLLGANGAGKTTLMRLLAGLQRPTSGTIHAFGHDLATAAGRGALKRELGYLPQDLGLYPNLTAREFLDYMAVLKGVTDRADRARQVDHRLAQVRLSDAADRHLKTFSGGMKRRAGIAQALLGAPRLIMVDEPTAGLDPEERVHFRNLLSEIATDCTVILSTHIVEDIGHSCRDVAILRAGRLIFRGAPGDLIDGVRAHVWTLLVRPGAQPPGAGQIVVSTMPAAEGTLYRIIGRAPDGAQPAVPTLEDAYLWHMRAVATGSSG
jgi:ABC-type multidrug transport system ATPase subunit